MFSFICIAIHECIFEEKPNKLPTASREIESIIDYVASQNGFDAAECFLNNINQKCLRLASFPNMGRKRDELEPFLRSFPIGSYLIFYRITEEGIEILRFVSGYQDLKGLFSDFDEE
jgi:toxin ParE1/3/4